MHHRKEICGFAASKTILALMLISHILAGNFALASFSSDMNLFVGKDIPAGAAEAAVASIKKSVIETERSPLNVVTSNRPQTGRSRYQHHHHHHHPHRKSGRHQPGDKLKNSWCQLDCAEVTSGSVSICGSDGRWYSSLCELKRTACQKGLRLFKRPQENCRQQPLPVSAITSNEREVRIVELKRRCNSSELDQMKTRLLAEFDGNSKLMFNYFDSNKDGLIEAHELWPTKRKSASDLLRYAQLWDEHSQRCLSFKERHLTSSGPHNDSKCWFYLDLPFEPQYPPNACSLSHLMLFELAPGHFSFTLDSFRRAFSRDFSAEEIVKKLSTELVLGLGESRKVSCLPENAEEQEDVNKLAQSRPVKRCLWTRYNTNLASLKDPHVSVDDETNLAIDDAQLYLSGVFRCQCQTFQHHEGFVHELLLRVLAKPRVQISPKFQWSLPGSRVSFECLYDTIDTSLANSMNTTRPPPSKLYRSTSPKAEVSAPSIPQNEDRGERGKGEFGLRVEWSTGQGELIADRKGQNRSQTSVDSGVEQHESGEAIYWNWEDRFGSNPNFPDEAVALSPLAGLSTRASITMASSRLILENIKLNDSGQITCNVEVSGTSWAADSDSASLLVQEALPAVGLTSSGNPGGNNYLWMFHDNGISIYRLSSEDGQEMELLREINGQSLVNAEVDGNWNQLTLCGGLNSEQAVICEWSDNALQINLDNYNNHEHNRHRKRRYVYVGQPNLNRVIIMDGELFEIVAIINTEPQPRKLFLYKPSRMHLSKWLRRRLSPASNRHWLSAIERGQTHPLLKTPSDSRLASDRHQYHSSTFTSGSRGTHRNRRESLELESAQTIHQFDLWLLCYGQPLVVNPAGDGLSADDQPVYFNSTGGGGQNTNEPFTPRLKPVSANSYWPQNGALGNRNLEARLRNRKSVHIIQSSFLPLMGVGSHQHDTVTDSPAEEDATRAHKPRRNLTVVGQFQHSTVLTTHHIYTADGKHQQSRNLDLIHNLVVPPKAHPLELSSGHKIHYAYVTHYNQPSLFRVNMDEYKYDKEIELDCDPINLITSAQGLLVVQCRSLITHNLIGQLVIDELTGSRIEFNDNIRAQESYLSPDHRYLISIYSEPVEGNSAQIGSKSETGNPEHQQQRQSIIYVQLVGVAGLKLEYEIKTLSLEIGQCSFVWKDGYYAAVFVSSNFREQQSEILSLRLADGRLELTARVPGLMSSMRHKDQLIVSSELRLAALTTNLASYVVDLEENRASKLQTLRRHQSPPTLLWI